jgi:hypothetical protein
VCRRPAGRGRFRCTRPGHRARRPVRVRRPAPWNAGDFGDALYTIGGSLSSNVTGALELKVELLETVSTRPPDPDVGKSDVALLTALVYKF